MIVCPLKDLDNQIPNIPALKKATEFLARKDIHELPDGKIPIDGERIFAVVDRYRTIETASPKFEYHRNYIDIQYIVAGSEIIGWAPVNRIAVTEPYREDKDIAFGTVPEGQWSPLRLQAGEAAVLWPGDGHAPRLASNKAAAVTKVVLKIRVGA